MCETLFNAEVTQFVNGVLSQWCGQALTASPDFARLDLSSLAVVPNAHIPSGRIAVWQQGPEWKLKTFSREVDVVLGRQAVVEGAPSLFPLVAIELKMGGRLNTDVIDAKDTIYGALKEQYPCLMTCFVLKSNVARRLQDATLLRNGRHFDRIITEWDAQGPALLADAIIDHLAYAVEYWGR
jgi:hypothetical protein